MRKALYIGLILLLAASCGPRVIKREKMERIIADMLIQDQQIKQDHLLKQQADTSLVYEGIFKAYGYSTEDFLFSVKTYLSDPSRMEKILGAVAEDLEARAKAVKARIALNEWREGMLRIYTLPVDTTLRPRPRVRPEDTLRVRFEGDTVFLFTVDSLSLRELDTLLFHQPDTLL